MMTPFRNEDPVCPACFHDMHDDCTGPGCYCDCQAPNDSIFEDDDKGEL